MAAPQVAAIDALVREIVAYQDHESLTDQQVADELGVPRSTWSAARLGHFTPGLSFAQKVHTNAPRFKDAARRVFG